MIGYIWLYFIYKKTPKNVHSLDASFVKIIQLFYIELFRGISVTKTCVSGFYFKCHWITLIKISDNERTSRFFCRVLITSNR